MKINKLTGFIVLLIGVAAVLAPTYAHAQRAVYVQRLDITGNRQVTEQKIRRVIGLKKGDLLEADELQDALKRLFATRQFDDIQAYSERGEGLDSVVVIIEVHEYPKVDAIRYEGNDHVNDDDLEKAVTLTHGSFVRPSLVGKDVEAITELYREKGYYRVSVTDTVMQDQKKKEQVLVYKIVEGAKVKVKHIDFIGVEHLDTPDVQSVMETKTDTWLRGGDFKPKEFEQDDQRIVELYKSRGFLDVEIIDKELVFSEDGSGLDIFVTVEEGPQYRVGKVTWTGNELYADSVIARMISLYEGAPLDDSELSVIQFNISSLYWDRGYIYSTVTPVKELHGTTVDLTFDIVQGNLARVNQINIAGNTKTSEVVIRRELVLMPGAVFASNRLRRSLREVFNLGFFAGPPQVATSQANESGDIDVTLRVEEKPAGQFRMGAGFSQLNRVSGFVGVTEPNFLGKGLRIGFDVEFSRYRQNYNVSFTEPWLLGRPTELTLRLYSQVQNQVNQQFFTDRRTGASIRIGRPFPWLDYTSIFGRYSLEEVALSDFSPAYVGPLRFTAWPQLTSTFGLTLLRNSTDNPFHATTGTRTVLNAQWTGGLLGGDVRFQRYEADFSWYHSLLWKFVLEIRNQMAVLDGYGDPSAVPDYELFRLGGNRRFGLRGYDFYEVVPEGNAPFTGGRFMNILTYEVSFPVAPPTVYGRFFFDMGNTWNSFRGANISDLRKGAGFGIMIELPMLGTVGLDYGYGFDRILGASWEPHITFGGQF